jgi:integrase
MTPLRQRMIEDMQLKGLSASTQEGYLNAVRGIARHYHRSPDELSEEDLRQYFLYLANEKKVARSTATVAICGIKFLYEQTLQQQWSTLRLVRSPRGKKLPVILSREEVRRALAAVRIPAYRACLTTIYACGLRANEGAHLRVEDVDSGRMFLHIIQRTGVRSGIQLSRTRCGKGPGSLQENLKFSRPDTTLVIAFSSTSSKGKKYGGGFGYEPKKISPRPIFPSRAQVR